MKSILNKIRQAFMFVLSSVMLAVAWIVIMIHITIELVKYVIPLGNKFTDGSVSNVLNDMSNVLTELMEILTVSTEVYHERSNPIS